MKPAVLIDRRRLVDLEHRLQRSVFDHTDLATTQILTGISHAVHVAGFPASAVALWLRVMADALESGEPVLPVLAWVCDEETSDARHA